MDIRLPRGTQGFDLALLPIANYQPASFRRVHMNPEDAFQAFLDLRAQHLVPIHWGTFDLAVLLFNGKRAARQLSLW